MERGLKSTDGIEQAVQRRRRRSAARSRRTRSGSSGRPATSCSTRCRPTRSSACRHRHADRGAAAEHRAGRRPAEHQQRAGAHHLADESEEQARGLQRPPAEESRLGDDGRLRSGHGCIVWNSPIYTTGSVKLTRRSPAGPRRGRLLDQLRALQHALPAGSREGAVTPEWYTAINKHDTALGTQWNAGANQAGHVSRSLRAMAARCRM